MKEESLQVEDGEEVLVVGCRLAPVYQHRT
jgi:hypothetical protein